MVEGGLVGVGEGVLGGQSDSVTGENFSRVAGMTSVAFGNTRSKCQGGILSEGKALNRGTHWGQGAGRYPFRWVLCLNRGSYISGLGI